MGPNPKTTVRVHSDDDTSFQGELQQYLLEQKTRQTNTGGYRPSNNSMTERRIGLVLLSFRAILLTATGGTRYYDQLWGPGIVHANDCVNRAEWSDGSCPYKSQVGSDYPWGKSDHVFGAKALHFVPKEKRDKKWSSSGQPAIWVGRSMVTPGADIVVPITWGGGSSRYVLGSTVVAFNVAVDDTKFPL